MPWHLVSDERFHSAVSKLTYSLRFLFGPPAVGKTAAGQELERSIGFRLSHIHQVIDLVTQFFEEAARSGLQQLGEGIPR